MWCYFGRSWTELDRCWAEFGNIRLNRALYRGQLVEFRLTLGRVRPNSGAPSARAGQTWPGVGQGWAEFDLNWAGVDQHLAKSGQSWAAHGGGRIVTS